MRNIKATLTLDAKKLHELIESASENFMEMESNSIHEANVSDCLNDYVSALLIYNQTLFKLNI